MKQGQQEVYQMYFTVYKNGVKMLLHP